MKLFLFVLLSLPLSVLAEGGLPNQPYIYVEGKAEIEKPADMVTLRFDLVTHNADQAKANQEVQAKAAKIFALMNGRNIAEKDVIAGRKRNMRRMKVPRKSVASSSATASRDLLR
jgi:uncharacterized protein YggE